MDAAPDAFPWSLLATGLAATALGIAAFVRPAGLAAVLRLQGGAPPSAREARRVPAALVASGTLWLFGLWGMTWSGVHGQRPYAVIVAITVAMPLAAALLAAVALYLVVIRRLRG